MKRENAKRECVKRKNVKRKGGFWLVVALVMLGGCRSRVEQLDLSGITDDGLEAVGRLTQLKVLRLGNCDISAAGVVHLKGLTELRVLVLPGSVRQVALSALTDLPKLEELDMGCSEITDFGVWWLREMPALKVLRFDATKMTDEGVAELGRIKGLRVLELHVTCGEDRSAITEAALERLRREMPETVVIVCGRGR